MNGWAMTLITAGAVLTDSLTEKGGGSAGRDTYALSAGMQLQENDKFALRAAVGKAFGKGYHDSKVSVDCQWYF